VKKGLNKNMNIYLEKTESTNIIAKEKAASLPHGSAVFAEEQTAGRGRFSRSFHSPPGTGIYFSVILHDVPDKALITPAAAVAVCRAVKKHTDKSPQIKWVNDILLDGGKICGILAEASAGSIVVGIGINFTTDFSQFPELNAASVFGRGETPSCSREELAESVISGLISLCGKPGFMNEYRALSCLIGEKISYMQNNEKHFGTAIDVDDTGRLLVKTSGGTFALSSGEVNTVRKI